MTSFPTSFYRRLIQHVQPDLRVRSSIYPLLRNRTSIMMEDVCRQLSILCRARKTSRVEVKMVWQVVTRIPAFSSLNVLTVREWSHALHLASRDYLLGMSFSDDASAFFLEFVQGFLCFLIRLAVRKMTVNGKKTLMEHHFFMVRPPTAVVYGRLREVGKFVYFVDNIPINRILNLTIWSLRSLLRDGEMTITQAVEYLLPGELAKHAASAIRRGAHTEEMFPHLSSSLSLSELSVMSYLARELLEGLAQSSTLIEMCNEDDEIREWIERLNVMV